MNKNLFLLFSKIKSNLDMGHPVVVKVGAGSEAFSASLTLVRLLAGVDTSVGVQ